MQTWIPVNIMEYDNMYKIMILSYYIMLSPNCFISCKTGQLFPGVWRSHPPQALQLLKPHHWPANTQCQSVRLYFSHKVTCWMTIKPTNLFFSHVNCLMSCTDLRCLTSLWSADSPPLHSTHCSSERCWQAHSQNLTADKVSKFYLIRTVAGRQQVEYIFRY